MSHDGISVPGNIRSPRARHFYITRMSELYEWSRNSRGQDNINLSSVLNRQDHIYTEALRVQRSERRRQRIRYLASG